MKTPFPSAPFLLLLLWLCALPSVLAGPGDQLPGNASILDYRPGPQGNVLTSAMKASNWEKLSDRDILGTNFELILYRNYPVVQLFVSAPACHIDRVSNRGWDDGHIVIVTPTTNIFLQGDGFLFVQSSQSLTISNHVETRILKTLIKTPLLHAASSNALPAPPQTMTIFSDAGQFNNQSDRVDFQNNIHLIDPQMDLTSDLLTIQFNSNGIMQSAHARGEVVLTTTNNGRATGSEAVYYVTNTTEMMKLTGDATWQNGDEQAQADFFLYDSTLHFLVGSNNVRVRWPNPTPGASHPPPGVALRAGPNGYRKLTADFATLQMPLTNGPVENMTALGHVTITNEADHSWSRSEQAVYERTNDSFALTGNPVWGNDTMQVKGRLLHAQLTNQTYRASGDARFKLNLTTTAHTNATPASKHDDARWLEIACNDLDYQTNLATFHDHVVARLFEHDTLRDTLACDLLVVTLESNHVVQAVATGHILGQSEPNAIGAIKNISCDTLTAYCWPGANSLKDLKAENNVTLLDHNASPKLAANAATNQLTATLVTAHFSETTNRIETATAEHDVILDQRKGAQTMHATGDQAHYNSADDRATLTGTPFARTQSYIISDSDRLTWEPKTNRFQAIGHYILTPIKSNPNPPSS